MKISSRIVCFILGTQLLMLFPNLSSAETSSNWGSEMGPGMMGGYGPGYNMGPGMMGGYGPGYGMMGRGMMGWGIFQDMNLSPEQKSQISQIWKETRSKQWAVMGEMMDSQDKLQELYDAEKLDSAAIDAQYKVIDDLRRKMIDNSIETHNRIDKILTKEQREKFLEWRRGFGRMMRGWGY